MPVLQGFIGGSYQSRSRDFDSQRCVNLYPELSESGTSKAVAMLVGTPGLEPLYYLQGLTIRAMLSFSPTLAVIVAGQYVHLWNLTLGTMTLIGGVGVGNTPVSLASNGTIIFVADGTNTGYVINPVVGTVVPYTNVSYIGADKVVFLNGSFIFNEVGTGRFWAMDPYSTTINPLYFATAEGSPDQLITIVADHNELWLIGQNTSEVWANNGDTTSFPYQRIDGAFSQQGTVAKYSAAQMDNAIFWLSNNERGQGMVVRTTGYQTVRVSTHAVERTIAGYAESAGISDAVAYTYEQEGHSFYVLSFPAANATWVYDASTKLWHERAYRMNDGQFGRHRSNCHMFFNNKNIVGDWETGQIYSMGLDVYSDAGNPLIRLRSSPHVTQELTIVAHNSVQIDMETGVGLQEGQGVAPIGMLRWSDDGGEAWSNIREVSIGPVGKRKVRARFTRLGQSRDRVYEFSVADPVKVCLVGAIING